MIDRQRQTANSAPRSKRRQARKTNENDQNTFFFFFFYLLFNQTPVAEEQIMEFSGGEGACTQPTWGLGILVQATHQEGERREERGGRKICTVSLEKQQGACTSGSFGHSKYWVVWDHLEFSFWQLSRKHQQFKMLSSGPVVFCVFLACWSHRYARSRCGPWLLVWPQSKQNTRCSLWAAFLPFHHYAASASVSNSTKDKTVRRRW